MNFIKNSKTKKNTIPYSPKQPKKKTNKKNVNNKKENSNLLKFGDNNFNNKKQVQRNKSSIIKKPESQKLNINKNYYDSKQISTIIKEEKKFNNLTQNKIVSNKSLNDSYKKAILNKSTINRNKSLNKIIISENKKKKSNKISSSLEKKVNSYLIPKIQKSKHISNNNNNQNYKINNTININNDIKHNSLINKLINIPSNKTQIYNNFYKNSTKYIPLKPKDNSFDNIGNGSKRIKTKDNNLKSRSKDNTNEISNLNNDIFNNKKIFNNSLNYNNFINVNINSQKKNKTIILQKDLNLKKIEEPLVYNNENENNNNIINNKELELKNNNFNINGKLNAQNSNNNYYSIETNKKDENKTDIEDKVIIKKINNIMEYLKSSKNKNFYKNMNNIDNISEALKSNQKEENKIENEQNNRNNEFLKKVEFKIDNNNNNLNIINKDEKLESFINKNIKNINVEKKLEIKDENEIENLTKENKSYFNLTNKFNNFKLKMNILNNEINGNNEELKLNNKLDNIEEPYIINNTKLNQIQTYNKNSISLLNNKLQNSEIKKIDINNIRGNYQNKIDLNKIREKEENIVNSITQSLTGLVNLGETCYMNTGLQNLIHCIPFIRQLFSVLNEFNGLTEQKIITFSFINLCISLIRNEKYNNKFYINSYDPSNFRKNFCKNHKGYSNHEQHDSLEFLRILLDDISKELNQTKIICDYKELTTEGKSKKEQNYDYNNFYLCRENSIIVKIFYSQIMNIFTCECGDISYSFEKILDIPLLFPKEIIDGEINLNDLLYIYFSGEKISWSLPCHKCGQKNVDRDKKIKLSILPEVIIFSLQRFNPITGVKINKLIKFEEIIDLKPFCDNDFFNGEINTKYKLFGISNHSGTINFGHYYSYTKVGEKWFEFNDSFVKPINLSLMSRASYFFFYSRSE